MLLDGFRVQVKAPSLLQPPDNSDGDLARFLKMSVSDFKRLCKDNSYCEDQLKLIKLYVNDLAKTLPDKQRADSVRHDFEFRLTLGMAAFDGTMRAVQRSADEGKANLNDISVAKIVKYVVMRMYDETSPAVSSDAPH